MKPKDTLLWLSLSIPIFLFIVINDLLVLQTTLASSNTFRHCSIGRYRAVTRQWVLRHCDDLVVGADELHAAYQLRCPEKFSAGGDPLCCFVSAFEGAVQHFRDQYCGRKEPCVCANQWCSIDGDIVPAAYPDCIAQQCKKLRLATDYAFGIEIKNSDNEHRSSCLVIVHKAEGLITHWIVSPENVRLFAIDAAQGAVDLRYQINALIGHIEKLNIDHD